MYVFVYGTLKRGHGNHVLLRTSAFLGEGQTKHPYVLYSNGGFPVASDQPEDGVALLPIRGEVYEVDDDTFARLDRLEGYPRMYGRQEVDVELGDTGVFQSCWMYFGVPEFWDNFSHLSVVNETNGGYEW